VRKAENMAELMTCCFDAPVDKDVSIQSLKVWKLVNHESTRCVQHELVVGGCALAFRQDHGFVLERIDVVKTVLLFCL
jgi:hypothetical protein